MKNQTAAFDINSLFTSTAHEGEARPLPYCHALNGERLGAGLFIPADSAEAVGWMGPIEDKWVYRDGTQKQGVIITEANIRVLRRSPRFVEQKSSRTIVANFETPEGRVLRDQLGTDGSLRSIYLLYFHDNAGKRLHGIPLIYSCHGAAAGKFSSGFDMFCSQLDRTFASSQGKEFIAPRSEEVYALALWKVKFGAELVGPEVGRQSYVTVPTEWDEPTVDNFASFFPTTQTEVDVIWEARAAYSGFAARYFQSCVAAGVNTIAAGVDFQTGEVLFSGEPDGDVPALPPQTDIF